MYSFNYPLGMRSFIYLVTLSSFLASSQAFANKLTFYYDYETGNVSFDTSETRTGKLLSYALYLKPERTTLRFRPENHILLTSSTLVASSPETVQEATLGFGLEGFFTIGDVLPAGLSEATWATLFPSYSDLYGLTENDGRALYTTGLGLPGNDPIEYEYGKPDREYDNRWDIVDPNTLDWATAASLIYHQGSGEVFLDTQGVDGGHISGFYLRSDGDFLFDEFTPPWDSPFQIQDANRIDLLGNAIEPGLYSLGNILDSGLSVREYEALITTGRFISRAGFEGGDLDLETEGQAFSMVFVAVPEPASVLLMSLAGVVVFARRKRDSNHA